MQPNNKNSNVSSTEPIKWGVLSSGLIAQDFGMALRDNCKNGVLYAVAATSKEKADKYCEKLGCKIGYGSYEELAKDPNVDIIYVAPIHPKHKDAVMLCLKHGKPVLCEKPFTLNAFELKELVKYAREKKIFLTEGMWLRYWPAIKKLNQLLRDGAIGEIQLVNGTFSQKAVEKEHKPRLVKPHLGGGCLMDLGVYLVSFSHMVFRQEPKVIHAISDFRNNVDFQTSILLGFPTGQAILSTGNDSSYFTNNVFIAGTKGNIRIEPTPNSPSKLYVKIGDKEPEEYDFPLPKFNEKDYNFSRSVGLGYEAEAVGEAWRAGKLEMDEIPLDESIRIMEILDAIRFQVGLQYPNEENPKEKTDKSKEKLPEKSKEKLPDKSKEKLPDKSKEKLPDKSKERKPDKREKKEKRAEKSDQLPKDTIVK